MINQTLYNLAFPTITQETQPILFDRTFVGSMSEIQQNFTRYLEVAIANTLARCVLGTRASPLDSSPIEPLQWMVTPLHRGVLNLSLTHFVIKLILTSKVEPPPKRLLNIRGNFLRTGGVQEQGTSLLTTCLSPRVFFVA